VQPPLLQDFPFPSTLREVVLHPPFSRHLVCLQFMWEVSLPLSPVEFSSHCHFYKLSHSKVAWQVLPLLLSLTSSFIYSSVRNCPFPPLQHSGYPILFATFFVVVVYLVCFLSLFSLGGSQSAQGPMLIWSRVVCGSITCHLAHLVVCISQADKKWCLAAGEPSWFLHLPWNGDAIHGLGVWRSPSFASSQ
jgi:hypothetical protein